MMKKGQGLSLNVLILVVLGLLVLGILLYMILGRNSSVTALSQCEGKGGVCVRSCSEGSVKIGGCGRDKACCKLFVESNLEIIEGDLFS
jgi:hypothetical protein